MIHEGGSEVTAAVLGFIPGIGLQTVKAKPERSRVRFGKYPVSAQEDFPAVFGNE